MAKPRLLILVRHAQSEGNKNREIHQTIPDHRVKLTPDGWSQAYEAGRKLRGMLRADDTIHFFTSPYRRTRETTEGILATLTSDQPEPSPFKRNNIKVYEEPRLREQDFGNFQPCSAEMERMWQERADYGHFFYRIPNGESAADAYDRISGFNESLWRQFGEDDFASVCVLVTHGLMSRVFLMKWYHFSIEYFEDLRNINHCEFLIMRKQDNGKYKLENKLRTWSELRRERSLLAAKERAEGKSKDGSRDNGTVRERPRLDRARSSPLTTPITSPIIEPRRRWGGCPNGCNHDQTFKIRPTLADLVKSDSVTSGHAQPASSAHRADAGSSVDGPSFNGNGNSVTIPKRRPTVMRLDTSESRFDVGEARFDAAAAAADDDDDDDDDRGAEPHEPSAPAGAGGDRGAAGAPQHNPGEPAPTTAAAAATAAARPFLYVGRDFGGTYSGHNSVADSDAGSSGDDEDGRRRCRPLPTSDPGPAAPLPLPPPPPLSLPLHHRNPSAMGRGIRANRLGDAPHSSDGEGEVEAAAEEEIARMEREELSVQESVY